VLNLDLRAGDSVVIGEGKSKIVVSIEAIEKAKDRVRIGVHAKPSIPIVRAELFKKDRLNDQRPNQ
jgi:sRNA-binding carbon storage regulator CsrA